MQVQTERKLCTESLPGLFDFWNASTSGRQTELPGTEVALCLQEEPRAAAQFPQVPHSPEPGGARPAGCVLALSSPQLLLLAPLTCVCVLHDYRRSNQSAPRNLSNSRVPRKGLQQLERWWLSSMVSLASCWSLARTAVQVLAPLFGSLLSCWHQ